MTEALTPSALGLLVGRAHLLVDQYDDANEADRKAMIAKLGDALDKFWSED